MAVLAEVRRAVRILLAYLRCLVKLGFLDGIPILWTVVIFIVLIGVIYYLAAGRTKAFAPVTAPSGDDAPLLAGAPDD